MKLTKVFIYLSTSLFFYFNCNAQTDKQEEYKNPLFYSLNFHPLGYIVPHSSELKEVDLRNPLGAQLDIGWHLNTQKSWDQCRCYPRVGLSLLVFDYQNPDELGQSFNLTGFIEPFIGFNNRVKTSFRLGGGITYLNQVYDSITNPANIFYSSPISFMLRTQLNFHYSINQHWEAKLSGHFQHISNGGISQPNKGMNFPSVSIGAVYKPKPINLLQRDKSISIDSLYKSKWIQRVFLTGGMKELSSSNETKYPAFGITFYSSRVLSRINALHLGVSYMWDGALNEAKKNSDELIRENKFSIIGGNEFLMGKFIFSQALGAYIRKPSETSDRFYHRWGLYYKVFGEGLIGVNLKAHRHVADILDFRVGYSF